MGHPGYKMKVKKVRHHIYLKQNSPEVMSLTVSKHNSLHRRAYDYLYEKFGKRGIDNYLKWYDKNSGLTNV